MRSAPAILSDTDYAQLLVDTDEGLALVRWTAPNAAVLPGDRVSFRGEGTTLLGNVNFGLRGVEDYHRGRGVAYTVSARASGVRVVEEGQFSLARMAGKLRQAQAALLQRASPPDVFPFLMAVWLGQRDRVERMASERYIETGTAHMLAVSGLHVGMVFFVLEFLLALVIRDGRKRALLILMAIGVFTLMTGARASTLRAAFMIALYLSARFVKREPDAATSLSLAAILFLLWDPRLLYDAGALLSFGSVASLLCYSDRIGSALARTFHLPFRWGNFLAPGIAVQVLTLPLVAIFFQVAPLAAPLTNLIAVPLLGVVLMACVMLSMAGAVLPDFAPLFGYLAWLPWQGIEWTVLGAARLEFLSWRVAPPTGFALACYYLAVLLPLAWAGPQLAMRELAPGENAPPRRWPLPRLVLVAALMVAALLLWKPVPPHATVDFLDVGHGDAAVVYPPAGGAILIDGGDLTEYRDYGRLVVLPYLMAHGVTQLDAIICTHPDRDHVGGLFAVLEEMPVERLLLSSHASGRPLEAGLIAQCRNLNIPVERLGAGDSVTVGGALFETLHPPKGRYNPATINDSGVVFRLSWTTPGGHNFSALLTGDIESTAEALIAQQDCEAQVLRVPHHGSSTSSTAAFLDAVNPGMGIVSTRQTGRRKALGPGVEERYVERGIALWRTDLHGGLRLSGDPPRLSAARGEH